MPSCAKGFPEPFAAGDGLDVSCGVGVELVAVVELVSFAGVGVGVDAADGAPPSFARRFARILSASDMVESAMIAVVV